MNAPLARSAQTVAIADLRDPGECARLESFVDRMAGTPFHRPAWLNVVERGTGQRATGLVAETSGRITGWLPLTQVHSPFFGRALVSSGFAVGGGVLAQSGGTARALCRRAEDLAQRWSCQTIELRGGILPRHWDITTASHCGFAADLAADEEAQLLAIPRKQRAEIRKGMALGLTIETGRSDANRAAHYAIYAESVRNLGTPVFPRSLFDSVLDGFGEAADILTVRQRGTAVASVLSLYHGGAVMPYWGGGTNAARQLRANEVMYFQLMVHAQRRGCTRFDFGRSKTGSGPYNYKKNWGFVPQPLAYASWSAPGMQKRNIDPTSAAYSRKIALWKRLPLPIANRLGPLIAKGLA